MLCFKLVTSVGQEKGLNGRIEKEELSVVVYVLVGRGIVYIVGLDSEKESK